MKRRLLLQAAPLGLAAQPARAQRPAVPWRVGVLVTGTPQGAPTLETLSALERGLLAQGLQRGRDYEFDLRAAQGDISRLPALVRELQASRPAAVVAGGNQMLAELAAQPAEVPVLGVGGLVNVGLARSLQAPGGRATGVTTLGVDLNAKRLELMLDALPAGSAVLLLGETWARERIVPALQAQAAARGHRASAAYPRSAEEVAEAFAQARRAGAAGVVVLESPLLSQLTPAIVAGSRAQRLPTMQAWPDHVHEGAVMGYGPWRRSVWEQLAAPLAKVLRGTPPGEIPVEQVTRVVLAVNRGAARAIGLSLSPALLARADEVIE